MPVGSASANLSGERSTQGLMTSSMPAGIEFRSSEVWRSVMSLYLISSLSSDVAQASVCWVLPATLNITHGNIASRIEA